MPLKPGQKKKLDVELQKIKGLEELERKAAQLTNTMDRLYVDKSLVGKDLHKEFLALQKKIEIEIEKAKAEIAALQKTAPKTNVALDKLVKSIAKDCSQVLPEYRKTKMILLRGVGSGPAAFMGRSWNNRAPKDSSDMAQKIYDDALKKLGFKALRSNSIFTTTDQNFAEGYGDLYYVFPKNGFKYHWNKHIQDLVLDDISDVLDLGKLEQIIVKVEEWYYKTYKKEINWYYEDPYEALHDMKGFMKKLESLKWPGVKQITIEKLVNWDFIKNEVGPTNGNFAAGLKSSNEMLISGEYYAINAYSEVAEYVLNALKLKSQVDDYF